jgi:hypothetical protein
MLIYLAAALLHIRIDSLAARKGSSRVDIHNLVPFRVSVVLGPLTDGDTGAID